MSESVSRLELQIDSTGAERNAKSLGRELNTLDKSGGALSATVAKLSGVLTSAFALDKTIRTVTAFQDSMLRLQATSSATTQAMSQLEKQSRALGATSRFSAQQAADAQNFLAMAGFKVNEILSATPSVMKFASAASLDLARSADIASNVLGGMQLPVSELEKVMNTMINTAQSANTNVSQLGEAFAYAAPLAVTAGISIDTLSASVGVLGDAGIQGGRAGTALVGVIRQLSDITPNAEASLAKYGISIADMDIKTHGLTAVLKRLGEANLETGDAIRIFGSEAAAAGLILSNNVEGMDELTGANEKAAGKLNEVANILDSGLSAAFASVNSAIEEMMLRTGDGGLTSTMKVLAVTTAGVISNFNGMGETFAEANGLSKEFARNIEITAGVVKGLGAVLGVFAVVKTGIYAATQAMLAFNAVAALNPLVLIAGAATAAGIALYAFAGDTSHARSELSLLDTALGDAIESFSKLNQEQRQRAMAEIEQDARSAALEIDTLSRTMLQAANDAKVGYFGVLGGASGDAVDAIELMRAESERALRGMSTDFNNAATAILNSKDMSDKLKKELLDLIKEMETAQLDSKQLAEKQQWLALKLSETGDAGRDAAAGISAADQAMIDAAKANDAYISKLNEQTQKVLDSRKSQVQLAKEYIALNKVTGDTASQMLKAAAALDAVNTSGKRTTTTLKKQVDELGNLITQYNKSDAALEKYNKGIARADKALKDGEISLKQYQNIVQGLYTDLNKPMWDKFNKDAEDAKRHTDALTASFNTISDRLDPLSAMTRQYAEDIAFLTDNQAALEAQGLNVTGMLTGLEAEYQKNMRSASEWGQVTERAMDSVDGAFVDMWRNIGSGFSSFADSLKNAFKNLLAEMAHMAITRPILMQIGAAIGVGGMSGAASAAGVIGGGGGGFGGVANLASSAYSALTGWGPAALAGYQSGGLWGGAQAVGGYYGNMIGNAAGTVGGWLGMGGGAAASGTGYQLGGSLVSGGVGNASYAAGGGAMAGNAVAAAPWLSGIGGAFMGYQNSGMKGAAAGGLGGVGGAKLGATAGANFGPVGAAVGAIIGGVLGAIGGSKLFGGSWQSKDGGLSLGVDGGDFAGQQYDFQKKKGGLFSSNKKRTRYSALDADTAAILKDAYDATEDSVAALYEQLGYTVDEATLSGLSIGATQISTMGKTGEQIEEAVAKWFADAAETINSQLDKTLGAELGLDVAGMQELVGNMLAVNAALETIGLTAFSADVAGAKLAESLTVTADGLESLAAISDSYYASFVDDQTKLDQSLKQMRGSFADLEVTTPRTREQFKALVESLDLTTEAGQETLVGLLSLSSGMSEYYGALENLERSFYASFTPLVEQNRAHLAGLNDEFKTLGQQMPESRNDFIDLVNSFDLTTDAGEDMRRALLQLAPAMNDYYGVLEQLAFNLEQFAFNITGVSNSLSQNIGGLREQIFLDQFDDKGKFDYAKAQADALSAMLPDLTDLGLIEQTTNDIIRLTQTAYGLLDEQGKQQQGAEFIKMLDELEALSRDRAAQAQLEQTEQQAKIMSDAMTTAAERMAASMESAMRSGAADQAGVAAMFESVGRSIMNQFAALSVSRFGEVT